MPRVLDPKSQRGIAFQEKNELAKRIARNERRQTITDPVMLRLIVAHRVNQEIPQILRAIIYNLTEASFNEQYFKQLIDRNGEKIAFDLNFYTTVDVKTLSQLISNSLRLKIVSVGSNRINALEEKCKKMFGPDFIKRFKVDPKYAEELLAQATPVFEKMGFTIDPEYRNYLISNAYDDPFSAIRYALINGNTLQKVTLALKTIIQLEKKYVDDPKAMEQVIRETQKELYLLGQHRPGKIKITNHYVDHDNVILHEYIHHLLANQLPAYNNESFTEALTTYISLKLGIKKLDQFKEKPPFKTKSEYDIGLEIGLRIFKTNADLDLNGFTLLFDKNGLDREPRSSLIIRPEY
jgi:hypothetical protein